MKTSKPMQLKIIDKMRENIDREMSLYLDIQRLDESSEWQDDIGFISDFEFSEYRIKPETITINGVEIPKPLSREEVAELSWGTYVYFMASNDDLFTYKERQFVERKDFNRVMCFLTPEEAIEASKLLFGIKE